jgi:hypothetical protein
MSAPGAVPPPGAAGPAPAPALGSEASSAAAAAALPRDLDVTPLKRQVLFHQGAAYLPLAVLVYVTEAGGSSSKGRPLATQEATEMLRYRAQQLAVPIDTIIRAHTEPGWTNAAGQATVAPQGDFVSHRGFLETLAFWMRTKALDTPQLVNGQDPFYRLKRFVEYQGVIGEMLFGVPASSVQAVLPKAPQPTPVAAPQPAAAAVSTDASGASAVATSSNPAVALAHLTPVLPDTPVTLSTPPRGIDTIQEEIEEAEEAEDQKQRKQENGDTEMKNEEAEAAAAASAFVVPSDGIMVHCTRIDGRDLDALTGKLIRILPELHLLSNMPAKRSPHQPISYLKTLTGADATIEEYWAARFFKYGEDQTDSTSKKRVRIAEVQLDDGLPYIFPCDKLWRCTPESLRDAQPHPSIHSLSRSTPSAFLPRPSFLLHEPKLSRQATLWEMVRDDPWNAQAWQNLIQEANLTHDLLTIRHVYTSFLKVFPSSAAHWRSLIELELQHRQYPEIERILPLALRTIPDIELWKLYLVYQKLVHTPAAGQSTEEKEREKNVAIEQAYEYVLEHMGLDLFAGQVWKSYINFVRSIPTRSSIEEQGKTTQLRKLYQRIIAIPIQPKELASFWEEYQAFEKGVAASFANKSLMHKFIADYQHKFTTVHREAQERRRKFAGISSASMGNAYGQALTQSAIHLASRPSLNKLHQLKDAVQMQNWIRYIRFESRKVEGQDMTAYKNRVVLAYRQCLLYCRHYPQVWYDYLHFLQQPKMYFPPEQIKHTWSAFHEALPYSILPALIHADVEEEAGHMAEAKSHYESLLQPLQAGDPLPESHCIVLPERVVAEWRRRREWREEREREEKEEMERRNAVAAGGTSPAAAASAAAAPDATVKTEVKPESGVKTEAGSASAATAVAQADSDGLLDIYQGALHRTHPLVYILLMRFVRRTEGVDAARKVFLLARRSGSITYHTYLYAAYAEHHIHNDLAKAQAIYGAGMKLYGDRMESYLLRYLDFLKETNDHNNLRLIFGRILLTESAESAEVSQHLNKKEAQQMRKAQAMSAALARSTAASTAAALAAIENALPVEAQNDPDGSEPDEWWPRVNGLMEDETDGGDTAAGTSARPSAPDEEEDRFGNRRRGRGGDRWGDRDRERPSEPAGPMPSRTLLSLWSSYVSFERDTAQEISVLVSAEEKRSSKLNVSYSHKIYHWIDRWRFMDLWSCSPALRQTLHLALQPSSMKLQDLIASEAEAESNRLRAATGLPADLLTAPSSVSVGPPRQKGVLITDPGVVANFKASVARPDFTRMSSFAASSQQFDRAATRTRYGGGIPVPEQILNVLSVLPPSHLYLGPFIHPQLILDMLQQVADAPVSQPPQTAGAPAAHGQQHRPPPQRHPPAGKGRKRRGEVEDEEEEQLGADVNANAQNDLYRQRQRARVEK